MQQLIQLSAVCGLYYIIIILYYLPPANLCEAGIVLSDVRSCVVQGFIQKPFGGKFLPDKNYIFFHEKLDMEKYRDHLLSSKDQRKLQVPSATEQPQRHRKLVVQFS